VLVSERDAAERMAQLLSKFSLNHFARGILIVFQRLADVGQQRARDEVITLNGNVAAERTLQHVGDGDALPRTGVEMLNQGHVDVIFRREYFWEPARHSRD